MAVRKFRVAGAFRVCYAVDHCMIHEKDGRAARTATGTLRTSGATMSVFGLWCPHYLWTLPPLISESLIKRRVSAALCSLGSGAKPQRRAAPIAHYMALRAGLLTVPVVAAHFLED